MKTNYLLLFLLFIGLESFGQSGKRQYEIAFEEIDTTIFLDPLINNHFCFNIELNGTWQDALRDHYLSIISDESETDVLGRFYDVHFSTLKLGERVSSKIPFCLTIKPGAIPSGERTIVLMINVVDEQKREDTNNVSNDKKMTIKLKDQKKEDKLTGYNYLGYIGTNFDLVDGIKAKNLFFATNFFLPPVSSNKKAVGAYISLYGNRTNTRNDTLNDLIRPYKYVALSDTIRYFREKTDVERSSVSDNLGAAASPLIRLGKISMPDNDLRMYYAPTAEFIWRRTNVKYSYNEVPQHYDVFDVPTNIQPNSDTVFLPRSTNFSYNQFDVNLGLIGMMVCHENEAISIRLSISAGPQLSYIPIGMTTNTDLLSVSGIYKQTTNFFFAGRLWVTEPVSGLTLQAEVTNTWSNAKPYFGVTLSKALEYKNLGKIFQPISSR